MIRALLAIVVLVPSIAIAQSSVGELQRASDRAQQTHDEAATVDTAVFDLHAVEVRPEFPGGEAAMFTYLHKCFQHPTCGEISGKVYVEFIIRMDGQVSDVLVRRGLAKALDEEVIRVVKTMPSWIPGRQGGRAVAVRQVIPIAFGR